MGAKTWMLVYADRNARDALQRRPALDREATAAFVGTLFPGEQLTALDDGDLSFTCPPDNEICAGCFDGVSVVAASEFGGDHPSRLPARFIAARRGTATLHAMHSVVDWAGQHPAVENGEQDAYPFPFHPLDLGEAALAALFGYHIEGPIDPALLAPETVPLARFKRSRSRWKFWK